MIDAEQTFNPQPTRPRLLLPAGACDAHVHVFGPSGKFPYSQTRSFTPADAPKEKLFALHRYLGISRCVIVQSTIYAFDNSVVQDAMAAGKGHYLGIALAPCDISDGDLEKLANAGFRGVRFNLIPGLARNAEPEEIVKFTHRLKHLDMHLQVHFVSSLVHELSSILKKSAVPVVIDHMGRVDATLGADHPDFLALCKLMSDPLFHVKVSGSDRSDATPPYKLGTRLARKLVESFPDRCFWGTDWPHPHHTHIPDDGILVDALAEIAPTHDLRERLLVVNPQKFYRFGGLP